MENFEGWTNKMLREELRARGAKVSGRKEELLARLESYIRNHNFGNSTSEPERVWTMEIPQLELYKDLTAHSYIPITKKTSTAYLETYEVKIGKKSRQFYKERFLRYAKSHVELEYIYIRIQMQAEMSKILTYNIDIQLGHDGRVVACQCECTAGVGPGGHCKHIRTALCGLLDFAKKGTINVKLSCTDRLQSFHKPRTAHVGSPIKAQDLGLVLDTSVSNILFDPLEDWEDESDDQFNNRFRNVVINDCVARKESVPIMQLFAPANPYAMDLDHCYLGKLQSDIFLEREGITKTSAEAVCQIEVATRGQRNNPAWKEERKKHITSSNFGTVTKATAIRDMNQLAVEMMFPRDLSNVEAIKHGNDYEDVAIERYEEITGTKVQRLGLLVDQERPYLGASLDGLVDDCVVEVKCPFASKGKPIDHVTVPYLKKTPKGLALHKNHDYYFQIQGQLHIAKKSICHLVVYTIADFKVIDVLPDPDVVTAMMERLDNFFVNHFKPMYLQKFFYKDYNCYDWMEY